MASSKYTYFFFRLPMGFSLFGHGLVRLPKLAMFSDWMLSSFKNSYLPTFIVMPFSYALPFIELLIGLAIILGLFTRAALMAGLLLMTVLIFGSSSIENWEAISAQLIHAGYLGALLFWADHNMLTLDKKA